MEDESNLLLNTLRGLPFGSQEYIYISEERQNIDTILDLASVERGLREELRQAKEEIKRLRS